MNDPLVWGILMFIVGVCVVVVLLNGCGSGTESEFIGHVMSYQAQDGAVTLVATQYRKVVIDGHHTFKLGSACYLQSRGGGLAPRHTMLLVPDYEQVYKVLEVGDE